MWAIQFWSDRHGYWLECSRHRSKFIADGAATDLQRRRPDWELRVRKVGQ